MSKLYFGDNLEIMGEMETGHVNLIATDPPFNSGRDYNAFIIDSRAENKAFTDTWTWGTEADKARADIRKLARANDTYPKLQFWQIDDTYFENEEIVTSLIQLPSEWLRPIRKSERHFEDTQARLDLRM